MFRTPLPGSTSAVMRPELPQIEAQRWPATLRANSIRHQPSLVNDRHVATKALDDLEHVRGQKNCGPAMTGVRVIAFSVPAASASTPSKGSSRESTFGLRMTAAARASSSACHGKIGDQLFGSLARLKKSSNSSVRRLGCLAIEAIHPAHETQIFRSGQASEQRHALGNHPDLPLQIQRAGSEILPQNLYLAPRSFQ